MTSDVTISGALAKQQSTNASGSKLAADFTQFLTLLTVQLQNQDPLSPMDSTEFTNQLVAFTGVEQQINTNQKLDNLVAMQLSNSMGSSLNYVGLDANYVSSEFNYDGTTPVKMTYSLSKETAASAVLRIKDEKGDVVFEKEVDRSKGNKDFTWDGKMKNGQMATSGTYTLQIDALDGEGKAVTSTTIVSGRVRGVEAQDGIIYLLVGQRAVPLGSILNVSTPAPATPPADDTEDT